MSSDAQHISDGELSDTVQKDRRTDWADDGNQEPASDTFTPRQPTVPRKDAASGLKSLLRLLLFGLAGVLIGLRTVARTTLPHIVSPTTGIDYQNVTDGNPVPHLLDWNQTQIDTMIGLRDLNGPTLYIAAILLCSILALAAIRMLNPGFRLFRVIQPHDSSTQQPGSIVEMLPEPTPTSDTTVLVEFASEAPPSKPLQQTYSVPTPTALSGSIEPVGLIKTATILVLTGLPVALCWLFTNRWNTPLTYTIDTDASGGRWGWIWSIRMPVLFAALWSGFHPQGLAGDAEKRSLNLDRSALFRITLQGAAAGFLAFLIGRYGVPGALEPLLLRYHMLGAFNLSHWHEVAGTYLLCMATAWFAVGSLFLLPATSPFPNRRNLMILAVLGLVIATPFQAKLGAKSLATRYDITSQTLQSILLPYAPDRNGNGVPDGPEAARLLAPRLFNKSELNSQTLDRNVLLFRDDSFPLTGRAGTNSFITTVVQNGITTDGLPPTSKSAERANEFLRGHVFQSALAWVATKHRYDVATLHFDTTAALTACLDDLAYGPHPFSRNPMARYYRRPALQIEETVQALFCICAATPRNLALLHRWADMNSFAFPDRQSRRLMGDLFRRFGDVENALVWYRRAEMPRTFLARTRAEQPLFHTGHVEGVLRLNGRPLVGVQVGLVPRRLNGLPHGLEGTVNGAIFEIDAERPGGPQFDAFHPLPNAFRWISGSDITDANGHFAIEGLTEGEYVPICTLPTDVHLNVPMDRRLHVTNAPLPFILLYGTPKVNLGIIDIGIQ